MARVASSLSDSTLTFSQDFLDFRVQITKNMNNSGNGPPSDRYTGDVKMNGQRNGKGFAK